MAICEDFWHTLLSTSNIDALIACWQESLTSKEGLKIRQCITAKIPYLASVNGLKHQFVDWNYVGEQYLETGRIVSPTIETFAQLVEAYDARYIEKKLVEDPMQILLYLQQTRGKYFPVLVLRCLHVIPPESEFEQVYAKLILESLLRLFNDLEIWNTTLMYMEDEGAVSEEWASLLKTVSLLLEARIKEENLYTFCAQLYYTEYIPGITNSFSNFGIPVLHQIITKVFDFDLEGEIPGAVFEGIQIMILNGKLDILEKLFASGWQLLPDDYIRLVSSIFCGVQFGPYKVDDLLTIPYHDEFHETLYTQANTQGELGRYLREKLKEKYPHLTD